ncbi:hypothetical protein, partial [Rhodovulum visakhapatnamense]
DIRSRAKLVSIADASLNHALRTSGIPFVNTTYIECERDLEHVDCFDPAFMNWARDAEAARRKTLLLCGDIIRAAICRPEDRPLQRLALLTRALIESETSERFTTLHRALDLHADLFSCPGTTPTLARARHMLNRCHELLDAMAELGEFRDPAEISWAVRSDAEPDALIATCAH